MLRRDSGAHHKQKNILEAIWKKRKSMRDGIPKTWSCVSLKYLLDFLGGSVVKNLPTNAGDATDAGSIPGSGRSPGEGNGNPRQYPCLGNSIDRGAWQSIGSQRVGHDLADKQQQSE